MTDINDTITSFREGDSPEPSSKLSEGLRFDDYRLLSRIGRGGMGEIWKAEDLAGRREVAIKFVPQDLQNAEEEMRRVKEMFQQVHQLHHQHICPLYVMKTHKTLGTYIVMQFIPGEPLSSYVRKTRQKMGEVPPAVVVKLLRPIAEALDYAHSRQVIHRDIKPGNILVSSSEDGKIKDVQLIDFGLAATIRDSQSRVSRGNAGNTAVSGTRPYMAPEQWRGHFQNAMTDQYALAVIVYELLSGVLPFDAADFETLRFCVLNDPPLPIPGAAKPINEALMRALAKTPAERFPSCVDFLAALVKTPSVFSPPPAPAAKPAPLAPAQPIPPQAPAWPQNPPPAQQTINVTNVVNVPVYSQNPPPTAPPPKTTSLTGTVIGCSFWLVVGFLLIVGCPYAFQTSAPPGRTESGGSQAEVVREEPKPSPPSPPPPKRANVEPVVNTEPALPEPDRTEETRRPAETERVAMIRAVVEPDCDDPIQKKQVAAYRGTWETENGEVGEIGLLFENAGPDETILRGRLFDIYYPTKCREITGTLALGAGAKTPINIKVLGNSGISWEQASTQSMKNILVKKRWFQYNGHTNDWKVFLNVTDDGMGGKAYDYDAGFRYDVTFKFSRISPNDYQALHESFQDREEKRIAAITYCVELDTQHAVFKSSAIYEGKWSTENGEEGKIGLAITSVEPGGLDFSGYLFDLNYPKLNREIKGRLDTGVDAGTAIKINVLGNSGIALEQASTQSMKNILVKKRWFQYNGYTNDWKVFLNVTDDGMSGKANDYDAGYRYDVTFEFVRKNKPKMPASDSKATPGGSVADTRNPSSEPTLITTTEAELHRTAAEMALSLNDAKFVDFGAAYMFLSEQKQKFRDGATAKDVYNQAVTYAKSSGREENWEEYLKQYKKKYNTPIKIEKKREEFRKFL